MNEVYYHYKNTIKVCQSNTKRLGRKINIAGTTRLIIVIAIIMLIVTIGVTNLSISLIGVLVVLLAVLFVLHSKWCEKKEYSETLETICNNELQGLDYDFSAFDGAADKIDTSHSFTYDLDIFGDNSIFQSINRTVTGEGREILVNWFSSPLKNRQQIELRQIAIKELSKEVGLREHFLTIGKLYYKKQSNLSAISKTIMPFSRVWEFLIWVIPVVWVLLFIMYAINIVQIKLLFVTFILCAIIANMCIRQIRKIHQVVNRLNKTLRVFSELIKIIEESELTTESYTKIKERFSSSNITASKAIKDLSKRLDTLDQRENFFIAILNVFVLCDIRCVIGFIKWQQRHLNNLNDWFEALAEFDALCSLSTFAYNHPDYIYPKIADDYFVMQGKELGHPLMNRQSCIRNDISVANNPSFMIITGANMAGKSTYLRVVGVNFLLAKIGLPLCAEEFIFYPCDLVTSLRTSDSLSDNESYFFAELKRLKMIIDQLRKDEKLFIVLDEILKGTNSVDKQKGSLALIRQFISLNTCGIIATHDLVLGTLHNELPQYVRNFRFEADIADNNLAFSYKLQDGIAENMNACFLMEQMGITIH